MLLVTSDFTGAPVQPEVVKTSTEAFGEQTLSIGKAEKLEGEEGKKGAGCAAGAAGAIASRTHVPRLPHSDSFCAASIACADRT